MRHLHRIVTAAMLMPTLAACEHKELCFNHPDHAPRSNVRVMADYEREWEFPYHGNTDWANHPAWESTFGMPYDALRPPLPDGLRVQVYNTDGTNAIANIPTEGGIVPMSEGHHAILFYNNDTEYIVFSDIHDYARAQATTRTRTRSTYMGNSYITNSRDESTVNPPDMLYGSYLARYDARSTVEPDVLQVAMHPLVYTYLVRFEFARGLEYVALARGALAGMARSVWLNSGHTGSDKATVLFDCTVEPFGPQAVVRSFGVPDFPNDHYITRGNNAYGLNLEVRLKNGKLKSFDFDITDQVERQPQGGVITVGGIEISDEEGKPDGGGGFDVDINDWGEYQDIPFPLK